MQKRNNFSVSETSSPNRNNTATTSSPSTGNQNHSPTMQTKTPTGQFKKIVEPKEDYATQLITLADQLCGFVSENLTQNDCKALVKEINESVKALLAHSSKPKIMVYGIYNSGKSTLINALLRENRAEMADRPKTDRITEYDHGNYILIDSPGVDAPIAHEKITDAYIDKCHVILFVISSKGGFESRTNYEKMYALMQKNIPFIMVLNDRGYEISKDPKKREIERAKHEQELREIQHKILSNLSKISHSSTIEQKYEVVVLNAKKAIPNPKWSQWSTEQIDKIYDSSRVSFLDKRIQQLIQGNSSIQLLLQQPASNLLNTLDKTELIVRHDLSDYNEDFSNFLKILLQRRENLKAEMRIFVRRELSNRITDIATFYREGNIDAAEAAQQQSLMTIQGIFKAKLNIALSYADLPDNLQALDGIKDILERAKESAYAYLTGVEAIQRDNLRSLYEEVGGFGKTDSFDPADQGFSIFKIFDIFKSRKRKEYERMTREADEANKRAQAQLEEEKRQRQKARQMAESDMLEFQDVICNSTNRVIDQTFGILSDFITNYSSRMKDETDRINRELMELSSIRAKLDEICNKCGL